MERGQETGFTDKTGRQIHTGDVLQHRLDKFGKAASGGPRNYRVIRFGKSVHLIPEAQVSEAFGGMKLTPILCEKLVVLRCEHMPV